MHEKLTTRFAPSPTGYLHIGGLRTALYNYLYARKMVEIFTSYRRYGFKKKSKEATKAIIEAFKWCGLEHDGEVTYQSERFDLYKEYVKSF